MANSVASVTKVLKSWMDNDGYNVIGTCTMLANPNLYVVGGIAFSLGNPLIKASRVPLMVSFVSQSGQYYAYVPGTTVANGKMKLFSAFGTELGAVAIPAANSGDTITFQASWRGML
jgi:hypothetical protein